MNCDYKNLEYAIRQAVEQCIREDVLQEFLIEHRAEVTHMMTLDDTFERPIELECEAAEVRDRQEKDTELIHKKFLKDMSLKQIADELEETIDAIRPF